MSSCKLNDHSSLCQSRNTIFGIYRSDGTNASRGADLATNLETIGTASNEEAPKKNPNLERLGFCQAASAIPSKKPTDFERGLRIRGSFF